MFGKVPGANLVIVYKQGGKGMQTGTVVEAHVCGQSLTCTGIIQGGLEISTNGKYS